MSHAWESPVARAGAAMLPVGLRQSRRRRHGVPGPAAFRKPACIRHRRTSHWRSLARRNRCLGKPERDGGCFQWCSFPVLSGKQMDDFGQQHGRAADSDHDAHGKLQILAPVAAMVMVVKLDRVVHDGLLPGVRRCGYVFIVVACCHSFQLRISLGAIAIGYFSGFTRGTSKYTVYGPPIALLVLRLRLLDSSQSQQTRGFRRDCGNPLIRK